MAELLYGASDVAELFAVEKCTVSNWARRYPDAPQPDFITVRGHKYWRSLEEWDRWHAVHFRRRLGLKSRVPLDISTCQA